MTTKGAKEIRCKYTPLEQETCLGLGQTCLGLGQTCLGLGQTCLAVVYIVRSSIKVLLGRQDAGHNAVKLVTAPQQRHCTPSAGFRGHGWVGRFDLGLACAKTDLPTFDSIGLIASIQFRAQDLGLDSIDLIASIQFRAQGLGLDSIDLIASIQKKVKSSPGGGALCA
jgi:hypothetical protein